MKYLSIALLSAILCISFQAQAEPENTDSATFQASIMAFGVAPEVAQQAAEAAIEDIEEQRNQSAKKDALEEAFANISDELVTNPYGF